MTSLPAMTSPIDVIQDSWGLARITHGLHTEETLP